MRRPDPSVSNRPPIWSLFIVAMVALAACGEGDPGDGGRPAGASPTQQAADADTYATNMCTAIGDWATSIQEGNATMQEALQGETSAEGVKQRLLTFLDDAVASTDQMLERIDEVGAPGVDEGAQVHQELVGALEQARTILADARDTVEALDSDDPQALGEGLQGLGDSLRSAFEDISNPLETLENQELDRAFSENAACQELEQLGA